MMSIPNVGQPMLKLVSAALVLLWACCVFFRSVPVGQARGGRNTRAPSPARRRQPAGYEWRKVRRLGSRVLAVRLQVILC